MGQKRNIKQARQRRQRERDQWRERAAREREEGIDSGDAAARWIADPAIFVRPQAFSSPAWRARPRTVRQSALLDAAGIPTWNLPTRGEAADALAKHYGRDPGS